MTSTSHTSTFSVSTLRALAEKCVHCGLCLPACPTYDIFRTEMEGPRGRIMLMRAAAEGSIPLDGAFARHIDLCLDCRACEAACPSGVPYGTLLETARARLAEEAPPSRVQQIVQRIAFRQLLAYPRRLRALAALMRHLQRLGLTRLAQRLPMLPEPLRVMASLLPPLSREGIQPGVIYPAHGQRRGRVAFFHGCVQDAFLGRVNAATVRVLQRNGYDVYVPEGQTCCGAPALHAGDVETAKAMARQTIDLFLASGCDAYINNAGGCGATLKEYAHLLADDPVYAEKARAFTARVFDVNEFLAKSLREPPQHPIPARATYVDSCHLRNAQKVIDEPRHLLRSIPGLELVELARPDRCCGSAGIYNITHPDVADQVLDAKMEDVASTGAELIVTSNTGCYLQMIRGVHKAGLNARVVHVVELLDEAYQGENASEERTHGTK